MHPPVIFVPVSCMQTVARCSSLSSCCRYICSFLTCKFTVQDSSFSPRWRHSLTQTYLINQQIIIHYLLHTFLGCWIEWENICVSFYSSQVLLFSGFTDGSVIVFVMLCYHNMESGCCCQCLIYGLWSQCVLDPLPNICSTGFWMFPVVRLKLQQHFSKVSPALSYCSGRWWSMTSCMMERAC